MDNKATAETETPAGEEVSAAQPRWKLAMLLNGLIASLGVTLTVITFLALSPAKKHLQFVDGFDGGDILMILAVIGFVSVLVGLFGASVCSLSTTVKKYRRIRYLVFAYIGWGLGLVALTGGAFYLTFSTIGNLDVVFKPGFTASMIKYQKDAAVKDSIDATQAQLKCCGNYNYTEWLTIPWTDAVSKTDLKIPPSCCDKDTTAAQRINCISNVPYGESIRLTPYAKGCVSALVDFYGEKLKQSTYALVLITFLTSSVVFVVFVEARDPGAPETTEEERQNILKKNAGKKETPGGKKDATKEQKKDEKEGDGQKPLQAATPTPLPPTVMGYSAMPYSYGYGYGFGAAPSMAYRSMPAVPATPTAAK